MAPKIAWIGLGNMGRGMALNLVKKGKTKFQGPLVLYNRTSRRSEDLAAKLPADACAIAYSIDEAVSQADIVFISMGDDKSALEVIKKCASVEGAAAKLFCECSTNHPDTTDAEVKILADAGVHHFVCNPVFGAPAMADAGLLICVPAGPKADVDKVLPFFDGVMAKATINLSDQKYAMASQLKVIGNTFVLNMVESLGEAHVMAEKSGVGVERMHELIKSLFGGPYEKYSERLLSGDYYDREEPLFSVDHAKKDSGHALNLAKTYDVRLKALEIADAHLADVKKEKGEKGDLSGIYGVIRQEAGLKYENKG